MRAFYLCTVAVPTQQQIVQATGGFPVRLSWLECLTVWHFGEDGPAFVLGRERNMFPDCIHSDVSALQEWAFEESCDEWGSDPMHDEDGEGQEIVLTLTVRGTETAPNPWPFPRDDSEFLDCSGLLDD